MATPNPRPNDAELDPKRLTRLDLVPEPSRIALRGLLEELRDAKPDGMEEGEWESAVAASGIHPVWFRAALLCYVPREGRVYLTGRGAQLLHIAREPDIRVLPHAVDRAQQRNLLEPAPFNEMRQAIADDVRECLRLGNRSTDKPGWVRLFSERKRRGEPRLRDGSIYVWSADRSRLWVLRRSGTDELTVVTGMRSQLA